MGDNNLLNVDQNIIAKLLEAICNKKNGTRAEQIQAEVATLCEKSKEILSALNVVTKILQDENEVAKNDGSATSNDTGAYNTSVRSSRQTTISWDVSVVFKEQKDSEFSKRARTQNIIAQEKFRSISLYLKNMKDKTYHEKRAADQGFFPKQAKKQSPVVNASGHGRRESSLVDNLNRTSTRYPNKRYYEGSTSDNKIHSTLSQAEKNRSIGVPNIEVTEKPRVKNDMRRNANPEKSRVTDASNNSVRPSRRSTIFWDDSVVFKETTESRLSKLARLQNKIAQRKFRTILNEKKMKEKIYNEHRIPDQKLFPEQANKEQTPEGTSTEYGSKSMNDLNRSYTPYNNFEYYYGPTPSDIERMKLSQAYQKSLSHSLNTVTSRPSAVVDHRRHCHKIENNLCQYHSALTKQAYQESLLPSFNTVTSRPSAIVDHRRHCHKIENNLCQYHSALTTQAYQESLSPSYDAVTSRPSAAVDHTRYCHEIDNNLCQYHSTLPPQAYRESLSPSYDTVTSRPSAAVDHTQRSRDFGNSTQIQSTLPSQVCQKVLLPIIKAIVSRSLDTVNQTQDFHEQDNSRRQLHFALPPQACQESPSSSHDTVTSRPSAVVDRTRHSCELGNNHCQFQFTLSPQDCQQSPSPSLNTVTNRSSAIVDHNPHICEPRNSRRQLHSTLTPQTCPGSLLPSLDTVTSRPSDHSRQARELDSSIQIQSTLPSQVCQQVLLPIIKNIVTRSLVTINQTQHFREQDNSYRQPMHQEPWYSDSVECNSSAKYNIELGNTI